MRQLLFDGLKCDTLAYHTDFSAVLECVGQDGATCEHLPTLIQAVFYVSYLMEDDSTGDIYQQRNDIIWHFWG